ncbi:MAG TPA: hypothetical protein DD735_10455 [Clostridiales bacterium]|nr:hypothetical protein [Clostridiales bacterium]
MTELRSPNVSDKYWVESYLRRENSRSSDYNFGNIYMWDNRYKKHLTAAGDRMIIRLRYTDLPFFAFPIGCGELSPAIDLMKSLEAHNGSPLSIRAVTDEHKALLDATYPNRFRFTEDRDSFDYIYLAEKLATFSGRKLHAKRNHCNKFEKEMNWDFVRLTPELIPGCIDMLDAWIGEFDVPPDGIEDEKAAILRGFSHWELLGLEGGVLRVEGKIVGFTIGEAAASDTFDVHFEKAFGAINGAYPMVCREFSRQVLRDHPQVIYINREEDLGLENLRKAKMDYYPEYLLRKYTATEV